MKNIKLKIFLIVASTFLLATCIFFKVQAQAPVVQADLAPRIYVTESHITNISGNEIKGEFTINNSESYYLSDLNYEIKLFQGDTFENLKLIDVAVPKEIFFVAPGATITKSFAFTYPKNINTGDYTLRAQVTTTRGTELGWKDLVTPLSGANKFLDIQTEYSKVIVAGQALLSTPEADTTKKDVGTGSFGADAVVKKTPGTGGAASPLIPSVSVSGNHQIARPLEGAVVSSADNVIGFLKAQNLGEAVTVTPQIKIYKRQFNMPLVKEYKDTVISFSKGETKDINLAMPKLDVPESYLAEVKFYQNNEQVSGIQYFRWVVKGDSGKIIYIKADKDFYKAGESINLTVQVTGPADASDGGIGQLEINVADKSGILIEKVLKDVSLGEGLVTSLISIPVKNDLISPAINIKLAKNGKILDEQNINLPVFSAEALKIEKEAGKKTFFSYLVYSLIAVVVILVAGFIFYKFKKKNNNKK